MPQFIKRSSGASGDSKSMWSYKTRRLFHALNEIPWLSLTALGTLLGVSILFWYFRSIGFFPADFSVLIGLGVGAAVSASGVLCALTLMLFAPGGAYRLYLSGQEDKKVESPCHLSEREMVGLQLGGVGLVFGIVAMPEWRDCGTWLSFNTMLSAAMLLVWAVVFTRILRSRAGRAVRFAVGTAAVYIAVASMPISLVVVLLVRGFRSEYLYSDAIFFTLWALAIMVNALAATRLRALQIWVVGGFVVAYFFIVLPVTASQTNLFPQMTASFLGIREDAPTDLRVPAKTCQLILSAVPEGMANKDLECGTGDWGKAKAQLLSKVGEQWLIEFAAEKNTDPAVVAKLRLTIPRSDVQIIREVEDRPFFGKPKTCAGTRS